MEHPDIRGLQQQTGRNRRLAFFHETNDYEASAKRSFEFVKINPKYVGKNELTFAGKDDFVPLQAADVLAYEGNKRIRNIDKKPRRAWSAIDPKADRIRVLYYAERIWIG